MKHLRFLNLLCLLGSLSSILLAGCTLSPLLPSPERIANSKVENPFFNIPPMNLKDYKDRHWILLAESKENNWFYDPYSLSEDDDSIVTFNAFISPRKISPSLNRFNASITGPYRQKIDCFGNYQWSEIFYSDNMPAQETFINSKNPNLAYGWIKIKPKTAMAYIRSRVCGRKFLNDKNVNYFLYQEGRMKITKLDLQPETKPKTKASPSLKSTNALKPRDAELDEEELTPGELMIKRYTNPTLLAEIEADSISLGPPLFYEVVNNEIIISEKGDVREMKIESYLLDKDFTKLADYVFRAKCQAKTYSFFKEQKQLPEQDLGGLPESLVNVAFNRICGDHGNYMKSTLIKRR
jgi:hypothetical protein